MQDDHDAIVQLVLQFADKAIDNDFESALIGKMRDFRRGLAHADLPEVSG
ncbi:hypothetical protein D557_4031 [Bordetella holmesii 70147]|nr:hypothetical protein D560_0783 [Bordetella holmesii ATCC 51541]EWM46019.1 hypothetical protein D557_4031 [Bordetella holmesii 70147]